MVKKNNGLISDFVINHKIYFLRNRSSPSPLWYMVEERGQTACKRGRGWLCDRRRELWHEITARISPSLSLRELQPRYSNYLKVGPRPDNMAQCVGGSEEDYSDNTNWEGKTLHDWPICCVSAEYLKMNDGHTRSLNVKTWNQCKGKPPPSYLHACTVRSNSANSFDKQGWKEVWDLNGGILLSIPESSETRTWEKFESFGKFVIWEKIIIGFDSILFTSLTGGKLRAEILIYFIHFKFLGWHLGNIQIYVSTSEMLPFHNENEKYWNQVLEMYEK